MPAGERMFMINGASSCVEVQGGADNPTVLLVGSSMLSWPNELCERLVAGGRRVIRYDVRDTGRSESYPPGEPGYSLADLVDDAVGVLDATSTEAPTSPGCRPGAGSPNCWPSATPNGSRRSRSSPAGRTPPARSMMTCPAMPRRSWR